MKTKFYFIPLFAFTAITFSLTKLTKSQIVSKGAYKNSHILNTNGSPNKKTGAPGEGSCVDCHSGSVNDGTLVNNLVMMEDGTTNVVTQYTPGQTYLLTLAVNATSTKKGFQTVALKTSDNTQAGSMIAVSGSTAVATFQGRTYVNHITASTSAPVFSFKWTAPSIDVGDVKFYLASNATNNNGNTNGDLIYLSQHTFSPSPVVAPVASFTNSSSTICSGNSVSFSSTSSGNPTSLTWTFPGGNPSTSNDPNPVVNYPNSGTFTATLTASNSGGSTTSENTINVQSGANLTLGNVTNPSACGVSDGTVTIQGSGSGTLSWSGTASGTLTTTLPATVSNLSAGSYTFSFNNGTSCPSNVLSTTMTEPGSPAAPVITSSDNDNIICSGSNVNLTSNITSGIVWSTGETSSTISVSTPGNYFVTFTENGCSSSSNITTVVVENCAGISENENGIALIYPNPTKDKLTIKNIDLSKFSKIQLVQLNGKILMSWDVNSSVENLELIQINSGSYLVKLTGNTETITKPLVIF
jgi:PKD repeat protein